MKTITSYFIKASFILLALLVLNSCECEDCVPAAHYNEPANIIPVKQAKEMYTAYGTRVPILKEQFAQQGIDYNPTRYVEYELEDIKHYINYIENEAKRANVDIENLRIYFGAYPDSSNFVSSNEPIPYPHQESIFITPTADNGGEQQAFFTRAIPGEDNRKAVFTKGLGEAINAINGYGKRKFEKASFLPFSVAQDSLDDRSLTMNRGNVFPPPYDDDDFGKIGGGENDDDDNNDDGKGYSGKN
jgi:hypothetical protein